MNFVFLMMLGGAYYGAADVGAALAIADQIEDGDPASAFRAFSAAGERLAATGDDALAAGAAPARVRRTDRRRTTCSPGKRSIPARAGMLNTYAKLRAVRSVPPAEQAPDSRPPARVVCKAHLD